MSKSSTEIDASTDAAGRNERVVMPDHGVIYLIPGEYDGEYGAVWCDDPAPGIDMKSDDAIKYLRADTVDALKMERAALIQALAELFELKQIKRFEGKTDEYLKRQPLAWDAVGQILGSLEA